MKTRTEFEDEFKSRVDWALRVAMMELYFTQPPLASVHRGLSSPAGTGSVEVKQ